MFTKGYFAPIAVTIHSWKSRRGRIYHT